MKIEKETKWTFTNPGEDPSRYQYVTLTAREASDCYVIFYNRGDNIPGNTKLWLINKAFLPLDLVMQLTAKLLDKEQYQDTNEGLSLLEEVLWKPV